MSEDTEDDENVADDRGDDDAGQEENSQDRRPEEIFFNLLLHLHPTRNFYAKVVSELPQIILYLLPQNFQKGFYAERVNFNKKYIIVSFFCELLVFLVSVTRQ